MTSDSASPDPVSWLLIEPGWKVVSSDGVEIGAVDEIAGDDTEDIFDGLAVATEAFGKLRYVLSEQVGDITAGVVHLKITKAEADQLEEYLEPATSLEIEADNKGGAMSSVTAEIREVKDKIVEPIQRHAHSANIWQRIAYFFRRR